VIAKSAPQGALFVSGVITRSKVQFTRIWTQLLGLKNMRISVRLGIFSLIVVAQSVAAIADPEQCRLAVDQYNLAVEDLSSRLRSYANCLSGSQGKDDCSLEFSSLRSAQSDFEQAVSAYITDCP
jgi:hypothetical protein